MTSTLARSRIRINFQHLELAKGHDGFMRGKPEPALIIGVYLVEGQRLRLLNRTTMHFGTIHKRFPCTVKRFTSLLPHRSYEHHPGAHFVVLAMAIEEDRGDDVQHLYAILDRDQAITVWSPEAVMPAPMHIYELPLDDQNWWTPYRVHVMVDGTTVSESCRGDDWVDASLTVISTEIHQRREHRMHFRSSDDRNDWTAELSVTVH